MNSSFHALAHALCGVLALAAPSLAQARMGSIYNPDDTPGSLISAKIAARRGDIVTVIVSENQNVKNQEDTDLKRDTDLDYKLTAFNIKPNAFSTLPSVAGDSTDQFTGAAKYEKTGAFNARLAAIVVDTLPNGNLVISGRREIRIDQETKLIEFSGIVRRYDVTADNTVTSELVANAQVLYKGDGPMTKTTNRYGLGRWIHDLIGWLWPF
jgi:flagellar L-ring protein precursor FlgH